LGLDLTIGLIHLIVQQIQKIQAETQQSGHAPRSRPEFKDERSSVKGRGLDGIVLKEVS